MIFDNIASEESFVVSLSILSFWYLGVQIYFDLCLPKSNELQSEDRPSN